MANLKQPKSEEELRGMTVANVKKSYISLASDYQNIVDNKICYCPRCGKWLSSINFYQNKKNADNLEHWGCKKDIVYGGCDYDKVTDTLTDNKEKAKYMCRVLDWVFIEKTYDDQVKASRDGLSEKNRSTGWQQYIVMIQSLPNWRGMSWDNSEFAFDDDSNPEYEIKENQRTIKKAKKRFGNYSNDDLMFLENEYQDWITRYECNTKAQEAIFERLSFKKWEINKATREGKPTKDLDKTYTELLTTANVTPKQNVGNAFTESLTFGQLIEKWELEKPIPQPEPEFRDINKIGKLITLFKGAVLRALNLDGGYNKEYDEYLEEYTVHKPEDISGEDGSATDDLYTQIFGSDGE